MRVRRALRRHLGEPVADVGWALVAFGATLLELLVDRGLDACRWWRRRRGLG